MAKLKAEFSTEGYGVTYMTGLVDQWDMYLEEQRQLEEANSKLRVLIDGKYQTGVVKTLPPSFEGFIGWLRTKKTSPIKKEKTNNQSKVRKVK